MIELAEHSVSVVVVAAGQSRRMDGSLRKPWLEIAGTPILVHTLRRFAPLSLTREIILVLHRDDLERGEALEAEFENLRITVGGKHRPASVRAGLELVSAEAQLVAIQDGVRPVVEEDLILRTCRAAQETGAAIPVVPVLATLKEVSSHAGGRRVSRTVPRTALHEAQTPQVFRPQLIRRAYAPLTCDDTTDDAQLVERLGEPVAAVEGSARNIKITTPEDLKIAELLLRR